MKYSEIRGKDVIDKNGEKVGDIIDCIVDVSDNKIALKHLVLGGGMIEELLESIGARPDIDPVCNVEDLESISDKVYLNVDKASLKKTIDPGVISENNLKFGKFSNLDVVDSDGLKLGNVIDLWFDLNSRMWLVLGGGFFEELLEKIRAQPDIDLLVPMDFIKTVDSKAITIDRTKFELESTCEDEYEKLKKDLAAKKAEEASEFSQIRFGSGMRMR
ncbi:MAG: PRC-barrel domain-containing protein [Candidatus Thorarchaeota archaeon]